MGEEYNGRYHYIYIDRKLINAFMPSGLPCEPSGILKALIYPQSIA